MSGLPSKTDVRRDTNERPLWDISRHSGESKQLPLYPAKLDLHKRDHQVRLATLEFFYDDDIMLFRKAEVEA